ncbi:hypothetical protein L195_g003176 [Trifolium pratense]|uniref:Uncharacterized protein n=1 Tax=Trifolium pratense TaxID=57577 RepID=A0A2K3NUI5_TRIPR|nr:hypothetical protein L195_g003176 [Trifolium pratense]
MASSSTNLLQGAAMETSNNQALFSFHDLESFGHKGFSFHHLESFGHKGLEETYQQLLADRRFSEPPQPVNEVHVLHNLIQELIKENQRATPPTQLNKRAKTQFRTPDSSSKNYNVSSNRPRKGSYVPMKQCYVYIFPTHVDEKQQSATVFQVGEYCWGLRDDFQCMMPDNGSKIGGNYGLWVAEWLQMQNSFNNQVVGSAIDEIILMMRMVMALLLGAHNEMRDIILQASNQLWLDLHVKRDLALNLKRKRR